MSMRVIAAHIPARLKPLLAPVYRRWRMRFPEQSPEALHDFWRQPADSKNEPKDYARIQAGEHSEYLVSIVRRYVSPPSAILEVGCNVGRNLHYLWEAGFRNLTAVEISQNAIEYGKTIYPEMNGAIHVVNCPAEEALPKFGEGKFALVFTMAVLQHIHPRSTKVFAEIVRITNSTVITIEDEQQWHWRTFPRNYKKVFGKLGMVQVEEHNCQDVGTLSGRFWARVFTKQAK